MELGLCQIFVEVNKFILGKPLPNYEYTKYALPALIKVMINENLKNKLIKIFKVWLKKVYFKLILRFKFRYR